MNIQDQFDGNSGADESAFRLLIESATDHAILAMDREGLITSWSRGAERMLGYREEEILGKTGDVIFVPEDRAADRGSVPLLLVQAEQDKPPVRKDQARPTERQRERQKQPQAERLLWRRGDDHQQDRHRRRRRLRAGGFDLRK